MNISVCDEDICWLSSAHGSCCNCELSDPPWSKSTPQSSIRTFDGHVDDATFDVNKPTSCTIEGNHLLVVGSLGKNPDIETGGPERGSQRVDAANTPKNNSDVETWELPGAIPPPESSSPVGFDVNSSPLSTDVDLPIRIAYHESAAAVVQSLLCHPLDDEQWHVKAPFSHRGGSSNMPIFPTTTSMTRSGHPWMPAHKSLDEHPCATSARHAVGEAHDLRTVRSIEQSNVLGQRHRMSTTGNLLPAPLKKAIVSGPTNLDLSIFTELESATSPVFASEEPYDVTTTNSEAGRNCGTSSRTPSSGVSSNSAASPHDRCLKRRRSSVDYFRLKYKKTKLDRTVSDVSCTSDASVESKYKATKPASFRRAESLRSEISACSGQSTGSPFDPSPLTPLISRPFSDGAYPPTVPSTPLPTSVDYARSRANPLTRTLAVYRRRSLEIPAIPKVPIIAPPCLLLPTAVYCAEDHAIYRLEALLLRESSERARDGLNIHDANRAARLKTIYGTDLSLLRRDSSSNSDSSNEYDQWEEEATCSATESQESQDSAPRVKIQLLAEQYRLATREIWTNMYGIKNDFRKEITSWILGKIPNEPVAIPGKPLERPLGTDLYDQLMNSPQTRFHAAQMFHRYFLFPEKVEYWREVHKHEYWRSHGVSEYECGVWDIAVACMALSVKLHRDCLGPLRPVFAAEFLAMAPQSMTYETLELVQRDVLYTFLFQLGTCTPQDVLDELWNASSPLQKATAPIGWTMVQRMIWDKLLESLLEPDMLQYPVTLLTAAALVDGLTFALASHYRTEAGGHTCKCQQDLVSEGALDETEAMSWQIHIHEASHLVNDVILDLQDVLHLAPVELDECRKWLNHVGQA